MKGKCKYRKGKKCILLGIGDLSKECYSTDDEPCEDYEEEES